MSFYRLLHMKNKISAILNANPRVRNAAVADTPFTADTSCAIEQTYLQPAKGNSRHLNKSCDPALVTVEPARRLLYGHASSTGLQGRGTHTPTQRPAERFIEADFTSLKVEK
ncbi:hypothetical protein B7494_g6295 [Chlorociboria aeruginascens]|nr:hypothetical protein B7494_g6295 [Chlorociboria aeruginascens]